MLDCKRSLAALFQVRPAIQWLKLNHLLHRALHNDDSMIRLVILIVINQKTGSICK